MSADRRPPDPPPIDSAGVQRELDRALAEIFTLKRTLVETQRKLKDSERHVDDLLTSTSWRLTGPLRAAILWLRARGWIGRSAADRARRNRSFAIDTDEYQLWLRIYSTVDASMRAQLTAAVGTLAARPLISIIMPSYNIEPRWTRAAIDSVRAQIYPHWELCISDDASTLPGVRELLEAAAREDKRIKVGFRANNGHISANSNSALDLATGDYVALMDADDLIPEDALFWVAHEIARHPETDLIYSDEDKIDENDRRFDPYFKPAWNPALMLAQNTFCHLGVYRRSLVEKAGRFREGYEGAQDHDLVLRCADLTTPERIRHIPRILYHWRAITQSTASQGAAKPYAVIAAHKSVEDHLRRQGITGHVEPASTAFMQINYALPDPAPLVSFIVPSRLQDANTLTCLRAVLTRTRYPNFEMVLVATAKNLEAARARFADVLTDKRVRTAIDESPSFNYSHANNLGARQARGTLLCLLNDDVEPTGEDWLTQLVARTTLPGVGAAGPMLYYPSDLIQHAGVVLGIGGVADHAFRNFERGAAGYFSRAALDQDYSCLTAACLMVRRALFDEVGGFDEALPVAFNDVDLCIRMRRTGARFIWTPAAALYHHESLSFGAHDSPTRREQFDRDVALMRTRYGPLLDADPTYNPNLSLHREQQFMLAVPPRTIFASRDALTNLGASVSRTAALL